LTPFGAENWRMAGRWAPDAPSRWVAAAIAGAAAFGVIAVTASADPTYAVTLAVIEALIAAMCALTWRSRRGAILAFGALTWAAAMFVTIVVPQATDPEALTAASGWGPALAVLLLGAGAFRFARPARRSDLAAVLVDAGAVLVALVWLLWKIQPGPDATWANDTALLWVGACTASLALGLVAHTSDHAPRMVSGGVFAVAFAGAALVAANPTDLPGWWIIPCTLGFVLVTCGALAGTVLIPDRRTNPRLWAQLLPVAPAAIAVWVALTHDDHVTPLGRWTLVAVIAAALLRQMVVSTRGHIRVRYLERTLGSFRHDAEHDPLTGLANRALFNQRIDRALERARRRSLAVLFLDLDDFKTINDTLGHSAGDELLVGVAQRLRATVRAEDTVARLGGDEFGILLNGLDGLEDAQRSARRILDALQPPFAVGGAEMRIGTSIGLAPVAARSTTSQLLREADMALYDAKEHGKNQFRCFSWTMQRDARDRFELQAELRQAIDREELLIYYQPIVDLPTGQVAGFEALARWNHSTRGVILPDRFIPLAEELGVIHALGLVVLRAACAQLTAWDATFPDAPDWYVAVNVAVQQFDSPDLLADVTQVMDESGIDPRRIVLEVTEGSVMEDPEHVLFVLQQLRELGVQVALDDFGTGYSALQYLRRFPLDALKVDKSFVSDLELGTTSATLLAAMLELGRSLGLRTVVEGVESHAQLEAVRTLGCDLVQGYLLATPGPAREVTGLLRGAQPRDWALVRGSGPRVAIPAPQG
jgi:diguanylate cyclase (GGDEF)-like protein